MSETDKMVKALRMCCGDYTDDCTPCPFSNGEDCGLEDGSVGLLYMAADVLERFASENAALRKQLAEKDKEIERLMDNLQKQDDAALAELQRRQNKIAQWRRTSEENFATCEKLNDELARVTSEWDAAIAEIERYTGCQTCKTEDCYKREGRENCHWQWHGPKKRG